MQAEQEADLRCGKYDGTLRRQTQALFDHELFGLVDNGLGGETLQAHDLAGTKNEIAEKVQQVETIRPREKAVSIVVLILVSAKQFLLSEILGLHNTLDM